MHAAEGLYRLQEALGEQTAQGSGGGVKMIVDSCGNCKNGGRGEWDSKAVFGSVLNE